MSKLQLSRFNSVILPLRVSLIICDDTDALFMRVSDVSPREGLPRRITRLSYSSNMILREGRVIHNLARASSREGLPSPARVVRGRRA